MLIFKKWIIFPLMLVCFLIKSCSSEDSTSVQEKKEESSTGNPISKDENTLEENNTNIENSGEEVEEKPVSETPSKTAKEAAIKLYQDFYLTSTIENNEVTWINGDVLNCNAGSVSNTILNKMLKRLIYFRKASGLNNALSLNPSKNTKAQKAALMMKANNMLGHEPPSTWKCYSEDGKTAASKSNLAIFSRSPEEAVDLYINDFGSNNTAVGHRRWLLWPKLIDVGIGSTDRTNAFWVIGDPGPIPSDAPEFTSWPPKGYIPSKFVYARWSFSLNRADFSNTSITMKDQNGVSIPLTIENTQKGFGDNTIVWEPSGINKTSQNDIKYTISIDNVTILGQTNNFEYEVILFDVGNI